MPVTRKIQLALGFFCLLLSLGCTKFDLLSGASNSNGQGYTGGFSPIPGTYVTPIGSLDDYARAVGVQADGKIVVAGTYFDSTTTTFIVARYNANGTPDTSFGQGGVVITPMGEGTSRANALVIQGGYIYVAGGAASSTAGLQMALARFQMDGALDTSFGTGGKVLTTVGIGGQANDIKVQADGKIVLGGGAQTGSGRAFAVVRFNTDGSLDTSFGGTGIVASSFAVPSLIHSIAIDSAGRIVAAGGSPVNMPGFSALTLARYLPTGVPDPAFGTNGGVQISVRGTNLLANSLAIQSADGKLVVGGLFGSPITFTAGALLGRFNSNGSLDTTFGGQGWIDPTASQARFRTHALLIQKDGSIVVAGEAQGSGGGQDFALQRYLIDGTLDTSFGTGGIVSSALSSQQDVIFSLAQQSDGKLVAAGGSRTSSGQLAFGIARYATDGTIDTSFGR